MRLFKWTVSGFIGFQILLWVGIIAGVIYFAPEIGIMLDGIIARFDHMIGY